MKIQEPTDTTRTNDLSADIPGRCWVILLNVRGKSEIDIYVNQSKQWPKWDSAYVGGVDSESTGVDARELFRVHLDQRRRSLVDVLLDLTLAERHHVELMMKTARHKNRVQDMWMSKILRCK